MTRLSKFGLSLAALVLAARRAGRYGKDAGDGQANTEPHHHAGDGRLASGLCERRQGVRLEHERRGRRTLVQGKYNKHTAEFAIAGRRLAWITRSVVGNSQQTTESLFTGSVGTRGRLLASGRHYLADWENHVWYGRWIAGTVGSGSTLAVSTWWSRSDGTCTAQRLSLVTPTGLRQIATGPARSCPPRPTAVTSRSCARMTRGRSTAPPRR